MSVSSPVDHLRDKPRQSENYSANAKHGFLGSNRGVSVWVLLALAVLLFPGAAGVYGQENVEGQWETVPTLMPINPVHVSLLHNGKILIVSGSGNYPPDTSYEAAIWDPSNNSVTTQPLGWDMFCSGMVTLPDGREMIFGGTLQYDPFFGWQRTSIYDPATGQFADMQDMAHGRWYPTATELSDGRLLVFSGLSETGATNSEVEIYNVQSGWSTPYTAPWVPPLYPRMHLLPNGNVFYSGWTTQSQYFYPASNTWSGTIATTNYAGNRTYGSSVLLPLTPANGYAPEVMIFGGGNPATATTEIINLSAATPAWVYGPPMSNPRIEMNATLLPNGNILTLGGSLNDEDTTTASFAADLFNTSGPITVGPAGTESYERLYHSVSLLLPDGTVWVAGGNPVRGTYVPQVEIYSPPYLFNADGTAATRPVISSVSPGIVGYGTSFQVQTPNAANISSVVLMKLGSTTHAFNMDQRMVGLSFTIGSGALSVTGPPNGNIAPPGYYMLFLLNSSGVPSIAQFVQVSATPTDVPPKGTITSPAGNVVIEPGQSVVFAGSGTASSGTVASYSWSLRGGTPNSSALASPGSVTYSTPGTYTASLTVADSAGNWDPSPPIRTIQVRQPAPVLSSVVPNSGSQGQTNITATITGSNFQPGVTCSFGPSITVSSCTENSSTQITAIISVQYNAAVGTSNLTVTNPDGGSGTLPNAFTVVTGIPSPAPTLTSVSPNSGEQNSTGLYISLEGANFLPNPICAFGEGIIVNTCVYNSSTLLIANITIPVNTFVAPGNVSVTNADGQSSTLVNGFTIVSSSNGFTPILLRGGTTAAYTDIQGIIWNADEDFTGGDPASTTHAIAGAIDPIVYQSERYGDFTYQFAVPNGPYNITLKFAEIYFSSPGQRQFNVAINGIQVLHNFDIVAAAGAPFTAVDKIFEATASAGKITIQFTSGLANYPKISAIEITNSSGVLVQLNPSAISLFPSQTQQFTTLVTGTTATGVTWSFNPQLGTLSSTGLYTAPASIAAATTTNVVATSVADPMQSTTAVVTLLPPVVAFVPTFVNSGGNAYTDTLGNSWAADNSFTGGNTSSTTHAIANTPDPTLYQTERYGDFSYQWAVPNGSYIVRLKFAEIYWSEPKQRVFNVAINGTAVLSDFDIVAAAGAPDTAIDEVFPVTVAGNLITIQFTNGTADLPKVSAIEITAASGVSIQVSPTTASLYASQAQQFTTSVTGSTNTAVNWTFNPQIGTLTATGLYTAPVSVTAAQTVTVTATSQADNTQSSVATVSLLTPVGSFASIFVNSGGNAYTDTLGNSWAADNSFTGGKTSSTTHAIANTPDPTLYQTERYGDFSYQFTVPNGIYGVTLKFAEIYWSGVGQRVFNVAINGTAVLSDFDIVAAAGAPDTAIDKTFPVTVSGGTITIQFTTGTADLPKVSAIEIKTSSGVGIQISPTSASLLSAQSQQFGATVTGTTNLGVNWTYNPQVGSLVTSGATAGLYSAPASVTTAQKISVTATSVADPTQFSSATVSLVPPFSPILVNSGGAAYTDSLDQLWSADKDFIGGSTASTTKAILNTADPTLYQTERYGDFSYQFIVANGSYNVVLKFAEIYWTKTGQRIFNVAINGTPVLTNFDIVAAAGAPLTSIDKTFPVTVTANQVTIQFTSGSADLPKVSAIQIH
ncbi:MAG: malectin domain-containing carbohydrate-binding protein [Candidatus Acidiferrales bacterium]